MPGEPPCPLITGGTIHQVDSSRSSTERLPGITLAAQTDDQEHGGAQQAAAVRGCLSADSRRILLTIWDLGNAETPSFLFLRSVPQAGKKTQHNVKCKDYFSNKLNLCCT